MPVVSLEMIPQVFIYILSHLPVLISRPPCLEHCIEKDQEAGARLSGKSQGVSTKERWVAACVLCVCHQDILGM